MVAAGYGFSQVQASEDAKDQRLPNGRLRTRSELAELDAVKKSMQTVGLIGSTMLVGGLVVWGLSLIQ